jgi:hypothetical protein
MQHQRRYVKGKTIHVREPHVWSNTGSKYYYQIIKPSGASRFALGKPRLNLASDKLINSTNKNKKTRWEEPLSILFRSTQVSMNTRFKSGDLCALESCSS